MRTCVNIWFLRGEILKGKGETACYVYRTQEAETNKDPLENKIQLKESSKDTSFWVKLNVVWEKHPFFFQFPSCSVKHRV